MKAPPSGRRAGARHVHHRPQHHRPAASLRSFDDRQEDLHALAADQRRDHWRRAYKFRDKLMAEVVRMEADPLGEQLKVIEAVYIP